MRKEGYSIKDICIQLNLPKSTVSIWCNDIELTKAQYTVLMNRKEPAIRQGQINGAKRNKQNRLDKIARYEKEALEKIPSLLQGEYYIAGLILYLAEGSKKNRDVDFVNSDPLVIKFMLNWFYHFFKLTPRNFVFRVAINQIHRNRDEILKSYWAKFLHVPREQFRKTVFLKSKQNKRYENHDNYFGTFRFHMLKGTDLSYRILGLISAVLNAEILPV